MEQLNNIERLKTLRTTLTSLKSNYQKLSLDITKTLNKLNGGTLEKFSLLSDEVKNVLENIDTLNKEIKGLTLFINGEVKKKILEEMENLKKKYHESFKGVEISFGIDGSPLIRDDREEYDNLYLLNKLLEDVLSEEVTIIDDVICVNAENVPEARAYLAKTHLLGDKKEPIKEEQETISDKICDYIDDLAKKISNYEGTSSLPIKATNQIGDKIWVVSSEDLSECNHLIAALEMLNKETDEAKVNVWNIGEVAISDIDKFQDIVSKTKYFEQMVPKEYRDSKGIEDIKNRLQKLIIKARNNPELPHGSNGLILESDMKEYQELNAQYDKLIKNGNLEYQKPKVKVDNEDYKLKEKDMNRRIDERASAINLERDLREKNANMQKSLTKIDTLNF